MTQETTHQAMPGEERFALLYSDGGLGILVAGSTLEDARRNREFADQNDDDKAQWTKIVRLSVPPYEMVEDPAAQKAPPISELDALRAEVARLKAKLGEESGHGARH